MPEIKLGEKVPGSYCPLCGEIGLRELLVNGVTWAICPMVDGEAVCTDVKKSHTAYDIITGKSAGKSARKTAPVHTPKADIQEVPEETENEEGVNHV